VAVAADAVLASGHRIRPGSAGTASAQLRNLQRLKRNRGAHPGRARLPKGSMSRGNEVRSPRSRRLRPQRPPVNRTQTCVPASCHAARNIM
jgi:hypothetical protein